LLSNYVMLMASTTRAPRYRIFFAVALALPFFTDPVNGLPLIHNDEGNVSLESQHIDAIIPHYEYGEELERGKIKRELELEINELTHQEEDIIKQSLKTPNDSTTDTNPRTNSFSNDHHDDPTFQINVLPTGSSDFYYFHQLPPGVNPDVNNSPFFNDFDFTSNLIEFELELDGWTTNDPASSTYEVRIMDNEVFGTDSNNTLTVTGGMDIALLGDLSFNALADGRYGFEFEFEQYDSLIDGDGVFISSQIYQAISDGILGIHIARTSGSGNLFLEESELELEQPATASVPEPATLVLLCIALAGMGIGRLNKPGKGRNILH